MSESARARSGSQSSVSSTRLVPPHALNKPSIPNQKYSSVDKSSHNHILQHQHHFQSITSWLHESWTPLYHRHEQIAVGALPRGMAIMKREMMEMQIQQNPDIRGMLDCLPTRLAVRKNSIGVLGYRQKLGTWPLSKHEALVAKQFST